MMVMLIAVANVTRTVGTAEGIERVRQVAQRDEEHGDEHQDRGEVEARRGPGGRR